MSALISQVCGVLAFRAVFMLCLPLSVSGVLCIQHGDSGCSDNYVGCTEAGLYNRGNSGDMQTGVRGPSINLTGCRSCQEYERMLLEHASQRVCVCVSRCAHTTSVPPSTTRASGPGRTASLCPSLCLSLEPQGSSVQLSLDHPGPEPERRARGRQHSPAQRSHQTVCFSVPRGNQFNSPQLLASRGRVGWGGREEVCVCVGERGREEMGKGGVTAFLGEREI